MSAFCTIFKKRGRPTRFGSKNNFIEEKKKNLFGNDNCKSEQMNLINLAFHCSKIDQEERDIASFMEMTYSKVEKGLGIQRLPSSSPNTWDTRIKNLWNVVNFYDEKSVQVWEKIKLYLKEKMPNDYSNFLRLITNHHSYEELLILKMNFSVMKVLKNGLENVKVLIENEEI